MRLAIDCNHFCHFLGFPGQPFIIPPSLDPVVLTLEFPYEVQSSKTLFILANFAGTYDSLPRRSGLHRQTSGASGSANAIASGSASSCIGSCSRVLAEFEKKVF